MPSLTPADYWKLIHAERARLLEVLEGLSEHDWHAKTLSSDWTTEQVVAHLTAGANTGLFPWMWSMARSGFNAGKHNERRLARYLGDTPEQTLEMFRRSITNTTAPTKDHAAWLGEVIVHGQDIARPLEIGLTPDPIAVEEVARFYAEKDFAVNSKSLTEGLILEANDSPFRHGSGPAIKGKLLNLVMAMAGRSVYLADLEGDGVAELSLRLTQ